MKTLNHLLKQSQVKLAILPFPAVGLVSMSSWPCSLASFQKRRGHSPKPYALFEGMWRNEQVK